MDNNNVTPPVLPGQVQLYPQAASARLEARVVELEKALADATAAVDELSKTLNQAVEEIVTLRDRQAA
jgi:hypothetical protein